MRTTGEGGSTKLSGVEKQGRKNGEIEVVEMLICFHVIYSFSIFNGKSYLTVFTRYITTRY